MLTTLKGFVHEMRHIIDEAVHESEMMDCEATIAKLFSSDARKLIRTLEDDLPSEDATLAEQYALSDDVIVLRHQCEDLHASNIMLQRHVTEERQKTEELLHRFDVRDNVVLNLKKHTLREGAHQNAGGAANYAAMPFELLEAMEVEMGNTTAQCKHKMDKQGREHEMSVNRQQSHYLRIIEAKEKEIIQLQMQFRNTLKGVQGSHASSIEKLQRENERLQRELAEAAATAMQKAEDRFELRFIQETKLIRDQCQLEVRAANETAAVEKARADGLSSRIEEIEKERGALVKRVEVLKKTLNHAINVEQPVAIEDALSEVEGTLSAANQASMVAEENATNWMNKFLELETSSLEEIAKLKSEMVGLQKEIGTLRHDFNLKDNQIRDINNAKNQAQQTVNDLKREMVEMKTELDQLRSQNSELVEEEWSKKHNAAQKEWSAKLEELQTALNVAQNENRELLEQLQGLQKRFDKINELLKAAEKDAIHMKLEKAHQEKEFHTLHQTYGAVVKASAQLQVEVNKLAGEVAVSESSLLKSQADLAEITNERDALKEQISKLLEREMHARSLSPDQGHLEPPTRTPTHGSATRARRGSIIGKHHTTAGHGSSTLRRAQTVATVGASSTTPTNAGAKRRVSLSLEPTSASPLSGPSSTRRTARKQSIPPSKQATAEEEPLLGDIQHAVSTSMGPESGSVSPFMVEVADRAVQCTLLPAATPTPTGSPLKQRRGSSRPSSAGMQSAAADPLPFYPSSEEDRQRNAFLRVELAELRLQIASTLIEEQQQRIAAYAAVGGGSSTAHAQTAPPPMPWNEQQLVEYLPISDFPTPEQVGEQNQILGSELSRRQAVFLAITGRTSNANSGRQSTALRFGAGSRNQHPRSQSELDDEAYYQVFRQAMDSVTPRPQTSQGGPIPSRAQTTTPGLTYTSLLADRRADSATDGVIRLQMTNTMPAPQSMVIDANGKEMLKASVRLGGGFKMDSSPRPKSATARMRSATPSSSRPLTPRAPYSGKRCGGTNVDPISYFNVRKRVVSSATAAQTAAASVGGVRGVGSAAASSPRLADDPQEDDFVIQNDDGDDDELENEGGESAAGANVPTANLCVSSYAKQAAPPVASSAAAPTFNQVMHRRQQQQQQGAKRPQSAKVGTPRSRYGLSSAPPSGFDM